MKQTLCLIALLPGLAFSQSATSFEAADVHVSTPGQNSFMRVTGPGNGLYRIQRATMLDLIRTAYGIESARIVGGPNWLEDIRFDVAAKLPEGPPGDVKPMLRALLAERFALKTHEDNRAISALALKVTKHALMKKSTSSDPGQCKFVPPKQPEPGKPYVPTFSMECSNMTMAAFAGNFARNVGPGSDILNGRLVVDQTELAGTWDFDFHFTPRGFVSFPGGETAPISLPEALEKQVGLLLEPVAVPFSVLVVDSVNRNPTPNEPGIADKIHLPPIPTEFDVADVKPTDPDFRGAMFNIQPGGRVTMRGMPMSQLLRQAWNLPPQLIIGFADWMNRDRFDVVAKADVPGGQGLTMDELGPLFQALLKDRFKLAAHLEQRPMAAYTLVAARPKMKKADPASRTRCVEGPAPDEKDPRDKNPIASRLITCQNITMAEFAARLQNLASGYIFSPVVDATGLEGGYDFSLNFSPAGVAQMGRMGNPQQNNNGPGATPVAQDPTGAISLLDAMEKQLGLKLQSEKRPVEVLVIDHIEQKPADN
ncbi:MAG TPA: TIGR03435 family protein [Bryobacteraceae bacterium]|nr:TIGR03435 family protein [Bryobacteraceae bacterium]